jgi:mRNA-degrading endonuclease RelE of RelBE toxin-antitoxin system
MSRHGKFAEGKDRISVVTDKVLKDDLKQLAADDRRKLSDYVRIQLEDIVRKAKDLRAKRNGPNQQK